jgi:hypothetical protein
MCVSELHSLQPSIQCRLQRLPGVPARCPGEIIQAKARMKTQQRIGNCGITTEVTDTGSAEEINEEIFPHDLHLTTSKAVTCTHLLRVSEAWF